MAHPFYLFVKFTSWLGLKLFFGGVELSGKENVPKDGAVIFAPNHQGAFMDAILLGVHTRRPVFFLTRADIFKKRWVISILKSLHMMPIYRIRDGIQNLSQNDAMFDTCYRILSEKKAILIFPEGNHGLEYYLRPVSKGAARLSLDSRDRLDSAVKLHIVPVGINYFSHRRPLAKVKLRFGKALDADQYMELYKEHKQKAYNKFKEDLISGMKDTLILADEDEQYEKRRDFIFQPKHEGLEFHELKKMAKSDSIESRPPIKRLQFLIGFLSIFNLPALMALKKFLPVIKDPVFAVSIKYLAGSLFHILWWSLVYALGVIFIGWEAGLLFAFTLILIAFARQSLIKF